MLLRLRQPKYLMGAVVGGAYIYFFLFRRVQPSNAVGPPPLIGAVVGLLLLGGRLVFTWLSPEENPGLRFSEADICFLFPAPMTRRMLIQYNLFSSQFTILISSVCLALISNRWAALGGNMFTHAVGWWVIMSTFNLQFTGAPLSVAQLTRLGVGAAGRRAAGLCALAVLFAAAAIPVWHRFRPPGGSDLSGPREFMVYVTGMVDVGPLHWLLPVFKIVFGPFLAQGWRDFFLSLGPALGLLALQYLWVVRMEISFEEGSLAMAQKTARFLAARREGRMIFSTAAPKARREPFRLADRGWPETAFLWKNLLSTWSGFKPRTLLLSAGIILFSCSLLARAPGGHGALSVVLVVSLIVAGYILLLGPQYARQDLRSDLANADILKTYPLAGWRIVLGELMAPVAILGGLWWLELLTIGLAVSGSGSAAWMPARLRLPLFLALALVAPLVSALQLLAPNATALLFPAWIHAPRNRGAGIDFFGQRLIFMFGQVLATAVSLLPAALSAALLFFASYWLIGAIPAIVLATGAAVVILVAELWIGVWWLGERFESFDGAAETTQ